jgi:endonuclease/exonuclease/phosphatase family metal-dependent hydrolase
MKTLLKVLFWIVSIIILLFAGLIFYATLSNYKPEKQETVFQSTKPDIYPEWPEIDIMIWNIGYCGLDAGMDFFYDGGTKVRTQKEQLLTNLQSIISELKRNDTMEFFLLQEVDVKAKRSYGICEFDSIESALPDYHALFGKNYDVFFVPVPPDNPMGKVTSGLQTLSKSEPASSVRWSFPGKFAWPKSLFMLDRCFLVNRYPMAGGRELVIVNTHSSAFDSGGFLRIQEINYLRDFLTAEYGKGNFVIVGGDWNQSPPGFKPEFKNDVFDKDDFIVIPDDFLPSGWKWAYDPANASNRRTKTSYIRGTTPATIIDFYLLSPNVQAISVNTLDREFRNSDHQPVRLKLKLLK